MPTKPLVRKAGFLAVVELLPFVLGIALVLLTYAWFGAKGAELWLLPEWWVAIVFMQFDVLRDGVRKPDPQYGDLDATAIVTITGLVLLTSCAFLILEIARLRGCPSISVPEWFSPVQCGFLFASTANFLVVKSWVKLHELKEIQHRLQAADAAPDDA
ncbi:MAG: hypothetical protein JO006_16935 [Paucibacter sp.]|nr:hypothetical protein [Roseateles sp.]